MLRISFAAIVSSLVMFSLAGLYTGVLAREFIASHVDAAMLRNPPNLLLVYCGYLALASLMSFFYSRGRRPISTPAVSGLRFGLIAAVVWLMPYSLVLFGVYRFPVAALPLDFGWALVEQGTGGLVIGLIQGRRDHA
jgi:hypothetical protein